jgi:tripartite-type tricarboxylate transporter receptor subunit TctC
MLAAIGLLASALIGGPAAAFPERPIRLMVPFAPGGASDILARAVGAKLSERLGQPVVVENRGGASGITGTQAIAEAPADGHHLLFGTISTLGVNPALFAGRLPYDPLTTFAPLSLAAEVPLVLVVNRTAPAGSLRELVELSRAAENRFSYASGGNGTSQHLAAELFLSAAGVRGSAPGMADLVAGHVNLMFDNVNTALPHIRGGTLRPLAVTGARRTALLPDVPTLVELGYRDVVVTTWFAFLAPAGTPAPVQATLADGIAAALRAPDVAERLAQQGMEVMAEPPAALAEHMRREIDKWRRLVAERGIRAD